MSVREYFADIKWIKLKISFALAKPFIQIISLPPVLQSLNFLKDHETAAFVFTQILVVGSLWGLFGILLLLAWMFFDLAMGNIRSSAFSGLLVIGAIGLIYATSMFFYWIIK